MVHDIASPWVNEFSLVGDVNSGPPPPLQWYGFSLCREEGCCPQTGGRGGACPQVLKLELKYMHFVYKYIYISHEHYYYYYYYY